MDNGGRQRMQHRNAIAAALLLGLAGFASACNSTPPAEPAKNQAAAPAQNPERRGQLDEHAPNPGVEPGPDKGEARRQNCHGLRIADRNPCFAGLLTALSSRPTRRMLRLVIQSPSGRKGMTWRRGSSKSHRQSLAKMSTSSSGPRELLRKATSSVQRAVIR